SAYLQRRASIGEANGKIQGAQRKTSSFIAQRQGEEGKEEEEERLVWPERQTTSRQMKSPFTRTNRHA
ncbi:unnamed protein product, partial [marine sediment metagenome]